MADKRRKMRKSRRSMCALKFDVIVNESDETDKLFTQSISSTASGSVPPLPPRTPESRKVPAAYLSDLKKVTEFYGSSGVPLEDEPFYHGYMERRETEKCLTKIGEFLVRKAIVRGSEAYIVSVRASTDKVVHLRIQEVLPQKLYWLRFFCFTSVSDLIRYHQTMKVPVYKKDILLRSYVAREQWQLYHEQVVLGRRLGHGAFGEVFQGTLTVGLFTKPLEVAVKTLKEGSLSSDDRITFLREANVMLKLQHKYVIRLYGVATQKEPIMIVMELASGGSLLEKVQKTQVNTLRKRKYCYQTICGMEYLESEQVIHRDLAARNCLVNSSDTIKISDFGLSLLGKLHKEKQMIRVPVRWLAPETLKHGTYSNKTDVWSCGVLMFEVFSNGENPYKELTVLREVRKMVIQGLRLKPPPEMPAPDASMMLLCFETEPDLRMSFAQLKERYKPFCSTNVLAKFVDLFKSEKAITSDAKMQRQSIE